MHISMFHTYVTTWPSLKKEWVNSLIACEEASAGNINQKQSVCHMGNKLLNTAENPVQECCYDILQLPITNSTHKKEFIATCPPEQCVALTKSIDELQLLKPNSTEVTFKRNIDRYVMQSKKYRVSTVSFISPFIPKTPLFPLFFRFCDWM